jgi:23S rRNA (pseudouridine1915-N3)-methyltransferase
MYITIYNFGEIKNKEYRELIDYYTKLCTKYSKIKIEKLKDIEGRKIKKSDLPSKITQEFLIILTEKGKEPSTIELAQRLRDIDADGKHISVLVGNACGFEEDVLKLSKLNLALSRMTFGHELAYLMFAEQLFRILNLNAGGNYHK